MSTTHLHVYWWHGAGIERKRDSRSTRVCYIRWRRKREGDTYQLWSSAGVNHPLHSGGGGGGKTEGCRRRRVSLISPPFLSLAPLHLTSKCILELWTLCPLVRPARPCYSYDCSTHTSRERKKNARLIALRFLLRSRDVICPGNLTLLIISSLSFFPCLLLSLSVSLCRSTYYNTVERKREGS